MILKLPYNQSIIIDENRDGSVYITIESHNNSFKVLLSKMERKALKAIL